MRLFLAAFFLSLPVYVLTLAPTVTGEDSGELVTAAWSLGIAHPPGYPLWCVLGKLFTVVPVGDVAYRVNLLSAVLAASAAGVLAHVVRRLLVRTGRSGSVVPLAAALIFAFSRDFWAQSTIAEVYSLNVLLFLSSLLAVVAWDGTRETRCLYVFAVLWGLALTHHTTMVPLGGVLAAYVLLKSPSLAMNPRFVLTAAGLLLVGLSIFVYLPIRSLADPPMDWGDPEGLSAFLDHVLRRQYAGVEDPGERTVANQLALAGNFAKDLSAQFTPALVPLLLLGAWRQVRRDPSLFLLTATLFLLSSYGIIWFFNYPAVREDLVIKRTFYLPAYAVVSVWLGIGISVLTQGAQRLMGAAVPRASARTAGLVPAAGVLLAALPLAWHWRENDRSEYYFARDLATNVLATLPEDSLIVPSSDHTTFPLIYLTAVEGLRQDVTIADKYGYIEPDLLRTLRARDGRGQLPPFEGDRAEKLRHLVRYSGREVFFTVKCDLRDIGYYLVPFGLLYRAVPLGEEVDEAEVDLVWRRYRWHDGTFSPRPRDYSADMILSDHHFARARYLLERERIDEALDSIQQAARHGWGIKEVLNNLGGYLSEHGFHEESIPYLRSAWDVEPGYAVACRNLTLAFFQAEKYGDGLFWFRMRLGNGEVNRVTLLGAARGSRDRGMEHQAALYYVRLAQSRFADVQVLDEAIGFLQSLGDGTMAPLLAGLEKRQRKLSEEEQRRDKAGEDRPPGTELLPDHVVQRLGGDVLPGVAPQRRRQGITGSIGPRGLGPGGIGGEGPFAAAAGSGAGAKVSKGVAR